MELNDVRKETKILLKTILEKSTKFVNMKEEKQTSIINSMEREIYNKTIISLNDEPVNLVSSNPIVINVYSTITQDILINLDPESSINSDYFLNSIVDGSIDPKTIGKLNTIDLAPEKTKTIIDHINIRKNQKIKKKTIEIYTCSICRHNKTTTMSVQLKAADEITNTQVTCENCGNTWII